MKGCLSKVGAIKWIILQVEKEEKLLKHQKSRDKKSVEKNPSVDQVTDQLEKVAKELEGVKDSEEEKEEHKKDLDN